MVSIAVNNIAIATAKIKIALEICKEGETVVELDFDETKTQNTINLSAVPKVFLQALMSTDLTNNQRIQVQSLLGNKSSVAKELVGSVHGLGRVLKTLFDPLTPTVEMKIGGVWYPVPVTGTDSRADSYHGNHCTLTAGGMVVDQAVQAHVSWTEDDFRNKDKEPIKRTIEDLLAQEGLRMATPEAIDRLRSKNERTQKVASRKGVVVSSIGSVLASNKYLWRGSLDSQNLGTKDKPRQLILEPELECSPNNNGYGANNFPLPFVRAFSLDLKKYVYADIDMIEEYVFDATAREKLVLPEDMREILNQVFETSTSDIFGDLFKGRHGGMIILADGPQGVGKTLTAEVFAEHMKRPLYVLEMGELGTDLKSVEESLQRIFARAVRWNAVLLFDEADVFLSKRAEADLERSAIVGVFLRLLDRYEGMFFLTTNRAEVIDPAFRSRITLKLDYPALDHPARKQVWAEMLQKADFTVEGDLDAVAEHELDGRQIRNSVRLLKVTQGKNKTITPKQIVWVLKYTARNKNEK